MHIQVLELPMEQVGEALRTPFVIVFSEAAGFVLEDDVQSHIKDSTGACGIWVFDDEVEIA